MSTPEPRPVEETLAWEAEKRPAAGIAAIVAGFLGILGLVLSLVNNSRIPDFSDRQVDILEVLQRATEGQQAGVQGQLAAVVTWLGENATLPVIASLCAPIALLLTFPALAFVFRATAARRPQFPPWSLAVITTGIVCFAVANGILTTGRFLDAIDYADLPDNERTNLLASDVLQSDGQYDHGIYGAARLLGLIGALGGGLSFVLVSISAMRVGLLTRFMGILGAIVGVTFVLPLDREGIIRAFWTVALGFLVLGKWPNGVPPAWQTGREEPWPTQQQLREQRDAERAKARGEAPPTSVRAEPTTDAPSPATSKKKRKKRR